ncbi:MAG: hypothetical protein WDM76_14290 [Limisphaerales bacterium]
MPKMAWVVGSLAPAAACILLTLSIYNSGNSISGGSPSQIGMIMSNQSYAAYALDSHRGKENNWSLVTFDWTNTSSFTSSIPSFPQSRMN